MPPSTGRKEKEGQSKRSKENRYHGDNYQDRGTPRTARESASQGREGYDYPGESSQSSVDQSRYASKSQVRWSADTESDLQTGVENLSIGSPNYTYAPTSSHTPTYSASSYSSPSQTAGSGSTYNSEDYTSYYGGNQASFTSTYSDAQVASSPAYPTYQTSYQTIPSPTAYHQSSYTTSYGLNPQQPAQTHSTISSYASGGVTAPQATSYDTSPTYAQGSTYSTEPGLPTTSPYSQPTYYGQQVASYASEEPERPNPVLPVTTVQCTCLGCDLDRLPKLKDGKDDHRKSSSSSRRHESSRSKTTSSSKKGESSKSKASAVSKSVSFEIESASGSNCGALYLSEIKPWAKPRPPPEGSSSDSENEYEALLDRWKEEYKAWKDTSCPCRFGYFNTDAEWMAGNHVRKYLKEGDVPGANPPNPRWKENGWKAPEQPKPGKRG